MADNFKLQAMGLTGLTIDGSSSAPSQTEFSQFLNDGVIDVTNRVIMLRPQDIDNFLREGSEQTSNGFNPGSSKIVSVVREDGTNNQWYPCKKSSMNLQYRVTDPESLHFASKYNPVYMISQNRNVHVFPIPTSDGNDTFKVLYVNYSPEETDGTSLDHSSTGIKWFPDDKVYLVVLYAAIQSLMAKITSLNSSLPSDITLPSVPVAPSLTSVTFTSVDLALDAFKPAFTTATISAAGVYTGDAPTFIPPVMSTPDFNDTNTWITTEEDSEMLVARVQEIQVKIGEFSARMAEAQAKFNKENVAYQSAIQESTQELQVANQVNLAEAQADLQVSMKNKDRDLQRQLQNGVNDMQAIINDNNRKTTTYQSDIQKYSAELAGKTQKFTTSLQNDQADYQWTTAQYASLKAQYNEAFIVMTPPAPSQQQQQQRQYRR